MKNKFIEIKSTNGKWSFSLLCNRMNLNFTKEPTWSLLEQQMWGFRGYHIKEISKFFRTHLNPSILWYRFVINNENGLTYTKWKNLTR
ncbi:hypothetical protein LCGC14_1583870 [marine sediment metagenome]|uniref:Uncharacterized protein n=1 Tax=marine sediment metagenome TaxID=412755 RepID=A0A0F9KWR5_9ZZZZ